MRKLVIGILLAGSAITPALAQDSGERRWHRDEQQNGRSGGHQQREQAQQQQQQQQQDRGTRFNGGNFYRQQQSPQFVREQQQVQVQEVQRGNWQRGNPQGGNWERRRFEGAPNVARPGEVQQQAFGYRGPVRVDRNRDGDWTRGEAYRRGEAFDQQTRGGWYGQRGAVPQQYAPQQYREGSRYASGGWNRDWRNDRHYDWRRYRDSHRSIFHLGLYIDPFGYSYRPFGIGYQLPPIYFGQRYWIDPALYDLPYPPPGTQWVRYWNDALLVDVYTGQVVDVIQGFFW